MRKFSEFEENIIKKMVAAKEYREESLATLINENIPAIALEWNTEPASFTIYYPTTVEKPIKIYGQVQEITYLLKYLENEKLINLNLSKNLIQDNRLYNLTRYERIENGNKVEYFIKMDDPHATGKKFQDIAVFTTDIGNDVMYYANRFFCVSEELRDLVKNKFKSPEQKRHNQVIFWTIAVPILVLIVTLFFGIWQKHSETIDQSQLNQIKQSIEQKTLPEVFKTKITNDTLTSKDVEMPKVKSTIQSK
ncbi:MAG TPA: hypothetical protein VIK10_01155 [Prolixibacteraceae bacterium]